MWGSPFIPLGDFIPNSIASSLINLNCGPKLGRYLVKYTAQTQTRLTGVELDREIKVPTKNISNDCVK